MFHYGTEATCQVKGKCSACGYEYYGEHDVAVPNYVYIDEMKCGSYCAIEGCDYLAEWSYHTGGTSDCQRKAVCEICHHEYGKLGDHSHGAEWEKDENNHWNECECGDKANVTPHADTDGNGNCDVCGYAVGGVEVEPPETSETPTSSEQTENSVIQEAKKGLGAGAIIGIALGSVAVVGVGSFAIFWFVIKKKSLADLVAKIKKK